MKTDKQFRTILDLVKVFPDERACHEYLAGQRWEHGVIECPHAGCGNNTVQIEI